jgi:plasmid stability protein
MGDLLIRNVPATTLEALKVRARRGGRSVQAEALELLSKATEPAGAVLADWLEANAHPMSIDINAIVDSIREDRDR